MPPLKPKPEHLRLQIEKAQKEQHPTKDIENRIAVALMDQGRFDEAIDEDDLANILRHVVYHMFARQKIAGLATGVVHNVPSLRVSINDSEARIEFMVHIHRPIVAFLEFQYVLVNDPVSVEETLRLKRGSLEIKKRTRRYDIKAKAALAAVDVEGMTLRELSDIKKIVAATLPSRLQIHGFDGDVDCVSLRLAAHRLQVYLQGDIRPGQNGQGQLIG